MLNALSLHMLKAILLCRVGISVSTNSTAPHTNNNTLSSEQILGEIRVLFDQAEGYMKSLEHVDGLYIPTVNQLRYAGRHLVDFLNGKSTPDCSLLEKTKRHCQRAVYDAIDAHIQYHINEVESFQDDFKDVVIADIFPEYNKLIQLKNSALEFLEEGLAKNEDRGELYKEAIKLKEQFVDMTNGLPAARDELNKKVFQQRRSAIHTWLATILAILGFATGILGFIF